MTPDRARGRGGAGTARGAPGPTRGLDGVDPILDPGPSDEGGPRLFHPLMGSSVSNLVAVLLDSGPVPVKRLPHVAIALSAALLRWPFGALERLAMRLRPDDGRPRAPVFVVGHWRSGTTHLYGLLARSPQFGYVRPLSTGLPWEFLGLGRALRPVLEHALPGDRFVDRLPVRPDSPQEDETALSNMQPLSFYHGLYFPRHFRRHFRRGVFFEGCSEDEIRRWEACFTHFLRKLSIREDGRRLLIKNPVYSARIARLKDLFPGAKFVHIHRNPYEVFQSTRHFYRALFRELALQEPRGVDVDAVVLESYPRIMERLLEDASGLPEGDYVEVRFDALQAEPMSELRRIHDVLGLEGFASAREGFSEYLESVSDYRQNRYAFPPSALDAVEARWGRFVERWSYSRPEAAT